MSNLSQETIYWYDFETTGVDAARDRAIQFAGVRTDLNLNVIGEPLNLFCKPGNDTIPVPEAIQVTGICMSELVQRGLPETEFIARILQEFSQPRTCVAGFNSLRFDDEFTRHTLYRNFLDPYAREWQGGNSRWDVIDVFRMAQALRPEGFNWPVNEKGVVSFRLEKLTEANGIGHANAHDAVADVLATIEVARKLRAAQGRLYDYLFAQRTKAKVRDLLYPLGKTALVHVSSMYPASRQCLGVVLPLCAHPTNSNGVIVVDLTQDTQALMNLDARQLHARLFTPAAAGAEPVARIPLKTVHLNRCPALAPLATLDAATAARLGIDVSACLETQRRLQRTAGLVEKVSDAYAARAFAETDDPDLMLYQGDFFSDADKQTMRELRAAEPAELAGFADRFVDPRLSEMLFRYRARNFPEFLSEAEGREWDACRWRQWQQGQRLHDTRQRIAELQAQQGESPSLRDLDEYVRSLQSAFAQTGAD